MEAYPARIQLNQADTVWESIWDDLTWIHDVKPFGFTPMLMRIESKVPYIYLQFIKRENESRDKHPGGQAEPRMALLKKIKASLKPSKPGQNEFEVQFESFTLDISNVLFYMLMPMCQHLFQMSAEEDLTVTVYGESLDNFDIKIFHSELALMKLKGFKMIPLQNATIHDGPRSITIAGCRFEESERLK